MPKYAGLRASAWLLGLAPLAWTGFRFSTDALGANPIEAVLLWSGRSALILLLAGLAITPIRRFTGWNQIIKVRRTVGLFAFFYVTLHFLIYLGLDQGFAWSFIVEDVVARPFITSGFLGFLLLIPLAVTSTKGWIRRLGRRWQKLHRIVYPAAGLGVLHFYWKVKADTFWPLVALTILLVLLLARSPWRILKRASG
ncbi:MAG: sulfoxide reductase heme-binding subunit YedZ [Gemmatimonadetes bacterium]|nr:sulfoxide reductase heme-binding subunit YedZ [Gemmatimonadota bacterium]NNM04973.1 sulfoxide reductase heme-binding subunit YedZ [Gemmatimonadota bacterium]